jgi:hypothetical protein
MLAFLLFPQCVDRAMTLTVPTRLLPLDFFWFIPTHGDGSYLGTEKQA